MPTQSQACRCICSLSVHRQRRRWAPALALLVLAFSQHMSASGAERYAAQESDTPFDPVHTIRFEESPRIGSAAFSKDGRSIFVLIHPQGVNIWALIVYRWPEVLGGLAGLGTLCAGWVLWRIVRRERLVGKPYCPKCNYCLEGCPSDRCPECGYERARLGAVVGRALWRRTLAVVVVLAMIVAGYASLWVAAVPRDAQAKTWFNWWSVDLLAWAKDRGYRWITDHGQFVNRVLEVEVALGRAKRVLITWPGYMGLPLALSPDGSGLLIEWPGDALAIVSTTSGRIVGKLTCGDQPQARLSGWRQLAGFSDDGKTAYVVWLDQPRRKTQLLAWDLETGGAKVVFEADAEVHQNEKGREMVRAKRFYHIPGHSDTRVLELPRGHRVRGQVDMPVRDLARGAEVVRVISSRIWPWTEPVFSLDGQRMYLQTCYLFIGIAGWDLATGDPLPGLTQFMAYGLSPSPLPAYDAQHERLFVAGRSHRPLTHTPVILALDMREHHLIGGFRCPTYSMLQKVYVSADGRRLGAIGFESDKRRRRRSVHQLWLYDLSVLDEKDSQSQGDN